MKTDEMASGSNGAQGRGRDQAIRCSHQLWKKVVIMTSGREKARTSPLWPETDHASTDHSSGGHISITVHDPVVPSLRPSTSDARVNSVPLRFVYPQGI